MSGPTGLQVRRRGSSLPGLVLFGVQHPPRTQVGAVFTKERGGPPRDMPSMLSRGPQQIYTKLTAPEPTATAV